MSDVVVRVEHLGKRFKIYNNPWDRAKEWLIPRTVRRYKAFWALRDISFELNRGGSLAIIGENGAGKSTLLKILTGALYPTKGTYHINGRVLSLLELGTGFNPEITGRQNLARNAQLLGFPKSYLAERLPDIEAFAELGDFIDRPLKFYSTGMRARLGFSLFAFLECDVLIIDEVLSVGDVFFRQKCYTRLEELIEQGTSIILVTHSMSVVNQYCQEGMVLDRGRVIFHGAPSEAIKHYFIAGQKENYPTELDLLQSPLMMDDDFLIKPDSGNGGATVGMPFWPSPEAFLNLSRASVVSGGWARCTGVALCDEDGYPCRVFEQGQWAYFYYEFEVLRDIGIPIGSVAIVNDKNIMVHGKTTLQLGAEPSSHVISNNRVRFRQGIKLDLIPADYTFSIGFATMGPVDYAHTAYMSHQEIASKTTRLFNLDRASSFSITFRTDKGLTLLHHGLADLSGDCTISIESGSDQIRTVDSTATKSQPIN